MFVVMMKQLCESLRHNLLVAQLFQGVSFPQVLQFNVVAPCILVDVFTVVSEVPAASVFRAMRKQLGRKSAATPRPLTRTAAPNLNHRPPNKQAELSTLLHRARPGQLAQ